MIVSGFTIVRNIIKFDYPAVEAIKSILPLVDEMIVLVGNSDDETLSKIEEISDAKIKIHHSVWDDNNRSGGSVLADQTNQAFSLIRSDADWAIYIQADECMHPEEYELIKDAMIQNLNNKEIDGLLFKYRHFYGSYDYIATSRAFYRNEIRIIRNNPSIKSYRDAQGFRKNNEKLAVKDSGAHIHHYGWVKNPKTMSKKLKSFHSMWHNDEWIEAQNELNKDWDYSQIDKAELYRGTHPPVMSERINLQNWNFTYNPTKAKINLKYRFIYWIESITGWYIGEYKNYILRK